MFMEALADITIIILAGGKSSRMGEDKGMMPFHNRRLIDCMLEKAQAVSRLVFVVANDERYHQLGVPCYADAIVSQGPMSGVYTALMHSTTHKNLVLSCDMPLVPVEYLRTLAASAGEEEVLVTAHGEQWEPLCSVYDKNTMPYLQACLQREEAGLIKAIRSLKYKELDARAQPGYSPDWFYNINTKEDLQKVPY